MGADEGFAARRLVLLGRDQEVRYAISFDAGVHGIPRWKFLPNGLGRDGSDGRHLCVNSCVPLGFRGMWCVL
jgi:hypothetical protein